MINEKVILKKRLENISISHWQYLFDCGNDPVFILDDEYNIIECNIKAEEIYGYSKEEFTGLNLNDIRAPYTRDEIEKAMNKSIDEKGIVFETRHRKKDGTDFNVEVSTKPFAISGDLIYVHSVRDITERKRIEEALEQSENKYHKLIDFAPVAIFIQCDNRIIYINPEGMKLLGAQRTEQVIGMSVFDFIHPDYHEIAAERISKLAEGMAIPIIEEKIVRVNGSVLDVEVIAKPVKFGELPATEIFMHDITVRKRSEILNNFLAATVERSVNPIIICSSDGFIVYWNKKAEDIYGYHSEEINNKLLFKLIASHHHDIAIQLLEKVKRGEYIEKHKMDMKKKDGEIISVNVSMSPIKNAEGAVSGTSIISLRINE